MARGGIEQDAGFMERIQLGRERREKLVQSFKGDAGSFVLFFKPFILYFFPIL